MARVCSERRRRSAPRLASQGWIGCLCVRSDRMRVCVCEGWCCHEQNSESASRGAFHRVGKQAVASWGRGIARVVVVAVSGCGLGSFGEPNAAKSSFVVLIRRCVDRVRNGLSTAIRGQVANQFRAALRLRQSSLGVALARAYRRSATCEVEPRALARHGPHQLR